RQGEVEIDYFKCPAWPEVVQAARQVRPAYVHFPLRVGAGIKTAVDTETKQPVEWNKIDQLLGQSDTPYINLHLNILRDDYPALPQHTIQNDLIIENALRDIEVVAGRYGHDRVIIENDHAFGGAYLPVTYQADFIRQIVEVSGCGFLLDLAHARLAANYLNLNTQDYIRALPTHALRELHVSGVQIIWDTWVAEMQAKLQNTEVLPQVVEGFRGRLLDHQPMTDEDWLLLDWALGQIRIGDWGKPWVVACEYSGVGPLWQAITDVSVLKQQLPLLWQRVRS
ncbi:partial hypothetical protein, partial [Anaerolineae bacterium]